MLSNTVAGLNTTFLVRKHSALASADFSECLLTVVVLWLPGDAKVLPSLPSKLVLQSQVSFLVQANHHQSTVECSTLEAGTPTDQNQPSWGSQPSHEDSSRLKSEVVLNVLFKPNFANVHGKLFSASSKYLPQYITVEGRSEIPGNTDSRKLVA